MKKIINFLKLYGLLFLIEIIISLILFLAYDIVINKEFSAFSINLVINGVLLWNIWRLIFYSLFLGVLFFFASKMINNKWSFFKLALFNSSVYLIVSLLFTLTGAISISKMLDSIFLVTLLAIIISPILLSIISKSKKIMPSNTAPSSREVKSK
ncbi:MAG: hypothetical protein ACPGSD_15175 [Flavobacteriales bacterium]